jgi:hypothetical protein
VTPAERLRIQDFVADCAEDAKRAVKGGAQYRATVLLRAPHLPDGGGGFNNALSRLRTLELISGRGELRVSEELLA